MAASAAWTSTSTRSTPATAAASGTRFHSSRAWVRWRKASLGANTVAAWSAARTSADIPPGRSWLARQCQASSAAKAEGSSLKRVGLGQQPRVGGVQAGPLARQQVADGLLEQGVAEPVFGGGAGHQHLPGDGVAQPCSASASARPEAATSSW